jgi:hypothetical protein
VDAFGNKEGYFVIRNVVGKEALSVYWFDTKAQAMINVTHSDRMVSNWNGTIRWKFHGNPVVFMGNLTVAPLDSVPGTCKEGHYLSTRLSGQCVECAPGFIMPPSFMEKHDNTACEACALGAHQLRPRQTACDSCAAGRFSDKPGSSSCAFCSGGTFQPNASATWCMACAPGYFSKPDGSVITSCTSCDVIGDYFQELPAQTGCQLCPPHTMRYVGDGHGWERSACQCKQTYYTARNESGNECTECPEGATCGGKLSPTIAARNWWGIDGSTLFVSCPTDKFNGRCPEPPFRPPFRPP